MYNGIIVCILYISIATLVGTYLHIQEKEKSSGVLSHITLAFIALLLLPLILNALGNDSLKKYVGDSSYIFFELIAYASTVALAGKKVLVTAINKLSLDEIESQIQTSSEKINKLSDDQNLIIKKQVSEDIKDSSLNDAYFNFLVKVVDNNFIIRDENIENIEKARKEKHINVYGNPLEDDPIHCTVTKIGKAFIEEKNKDYSV